MSSQANWFGRRALAIAATVASLFASTSIAMPPPEYAATPPVGGAWAGRMPGSYVEVRYRQSVGRPATMPARATTRPTTRGVPPATAPYIWSVEEHVERLVLLGSDARGHGVIERFRHGPSDRPDDWQEQQTFGMPIPGYELSPTRTLRMTAFRRDTITIDGHPTDCFVRSYDSGPTVDARRNPFGGGPARVEIWTLAQTDDQREGSDPDALILRARIETSRPAGDGRTMTTVITTEPLAVETEQFDGHPITTYRVAIRHVDSVDGGSTTQPAFSTVHQAAAATRPTTTRVMPEVQMVYSPDVPGYLVRYTYESSQQNSAAARDRVELGTRVTAVGVDDSLLRQMRSMNSGDPIRRAAEASEHRVDERRQLQACIAAIRTNPRAVDAITAALASVSAIDAGELDDEARNDWSQLDGALPLLLQKGTAPEITRAAANLAAARGLPIEQRLLALCDEDADGLHNYVDAAATLRTPACLPVLLRGVDSGWSFIRAAAADGLVHLDDPAAAAACERLANDKEEAVRRALLRTPADRAPAEATRARMRGPHLPPPPDPQWHGVPYIVGDSASREPLAMAMQYDYDDNEWFAEADDGNVRPTAAIGAPGGAIYQRLPHVDPTPPTWWTGRHLTPTLLLTLSHDPKPAIRYMAIFPMSESSLYANVDVQTRLTAMVDDDEPSVASLAIDAITQTDAPRPAQAVLDHLLALAATPTRQPVNAPAATQPATQPVAGDWHAVVAGSALQGLARLGDARALPVAIAAMDEPLKPRGERAIGAMSALRTFANDAALNALLAHAQAGPNAKTSAHALATIRDPRAAAWVLAHWLDAVEGDLRPAHPSPRPALNVAAVRSATDGGDTDEEKLSASDIRQTLEKALIRSADEAAITQLRAIAADADRPQALRDMVDSMLGHIEAHREGRRVQL